MRGKVEWVKLYFGDSERRVLRQHDAAIDRVVRTLQSTRSLRATMPRPESLSEYARHGYKMPYPAEAYVEESSSETITYTGGTHSSNGKDVF